MIIPEALRKDDYAPLTQRLLDAPFGASRLVSPDSWVPPWAYELDKWHAETPHCRRRLGSVACTLIERREMIYGLSENLHPDLYFDVLAARGTFKRRLSERNNKPLRVKVTGVKAFGHEDTPAVGLLLEEEPLAAEREKYIRFINKQIPNKPLRPGRPWEFHVTLLRTEDPEFAQQAINYIHDLDLIGREVSLLPASLTALE